MLGAHARAARLRRRSVESARLSLLLNVQDGVSLLVQMSDRFAEKAAMSNVRLALSLFAAHASRSSGMTDRPAPLAGRSISPPTQGYQMEIVV
jgi:hypothetical protein